MVVSSNPFSRMSVLLLIGALSQIVELGADPRPPSVEEGLRKKIYYLNGDEVVLPCKATGTPTPSISWLRDDEMLNQTDDGATLIIHNATGVHEGVYQCVAENSLGKSLSVRSNVSFARVSKYYTQSGLRTRTERLGRPVVLKCRPPQSNPAGSVHWVHASRGDQDFRDVITDDRIASDPGGNLYITSLRKQDKATYKCLLYNKLLDVVVQADRYLLRYYGRLRYHKAEVLYSSPPEVVAVLNRNITLHCIVSGYPGPTVTWTRLGEIDSDRMTANLFSFEIRNVQYEDEGRYECSATNPKTTTAVGRMFNLRVDAEPSWTAEPADQSVGVGESARFQCMAEGYPRPVVQWFINGSPLKQEPFNPKIQLNGHVLEFNNLTPADSQVIQCNATNVHGYIWADFYLNVEEKTRILTAPVDQQLSVGSTAKFTCVATTDPMAKLRYFWLRNGNEISGNDPRVTVAGGTLTITEVSEKDKASYTCVASNGLHNTTATAQLWMEEPPEAPADAILVTCLGTEAVLRWKFQQKQPIQKFHIEYNTSFTRDQWTLLAESPPDSRQANLNLSFWARYTFRVKAVNQFGESEPSPVTAECITPEGRPDRNPRNVRTVGSKKNHLIIEWEPMVAQIEHNAPDFHYYINAKKLDGGHVTSISDRNYSNGRKEIFVNNIYEPYEITVESKNLMGMSSTKAGPILGRSGEGKPKVIPQNFELDPDVTVSTSAGFQWDPVKTTPEAIRGEFNGYQVIIWKKGDRKNTTRKVFIPYEPEKSGKVRAKVHGIPAYSQIEAEVVAANNYFHSDGSNVVRFTTPEGVPSTVDHLRAAYNGSNHFLLEWEKPSEPNGVITGYTFGYQKINGLDVGRMKMSKLALKRRVFLGDLKPETLYRVTVWAFTRIGRGVAQTTDVKTTDSHSELARPFIHEVAPGVRSLNVSWTPSKVDGVRVGERYLVEYRKVGQKQWKRTSGEEKETFWREIVGLDGGSSYQVRITAATGKRGKSGFREKHSGLRASTTIELATTTIYANTRPNTKRISTTIASTTMAAIEADEVYDDYDVLGEIWFIAVMVVLAVVLIIIINTTIVCVKKRYPECHIYSEK